LEEKREKKIKREPLEPQGSVPVGRNEEGSGRTGRKKAGTMAE